MLHTAAYRLMLAVRDANLKVRDLARAELATCACGCSRLAVMIVGGRFRVRIAFAAACPEPDLIPGLSATLLRRQI